MIFFDHHYSIYSTFRKMSFYKGVVISISFFQKNRKFFFRFFYCHTFAAVSDSVAQLVEQQTLNLWVQSSSLCGVTQTKEKLSVLKAFLFKSI